MKTLELILPRLHPGQAKIERELKRFNVMACGRRFGKDVYEMNKTVETSLTSHPVAFAAPTYKVLSENWRSINYLVAPIIKRRDAQERRLELITGGVIDFWSLDNPDMIRGRKYKRFVINEAGFVVDLMDVWNYIIRPTLIDMKGDAIIGGTPKGRNGFWRMYQWGLDPYNEEWMSWQMTSYENPFVPKSEIDEMIETMPELVVRQEVFAEFLENEGTVFRNLTACMGAPVDADYHRDHERHRVVVGVDWGKQQDFTAISVGCADCRVELAHDRFNKIDYTFQRGRLVALLDSWGDPAALPERNSMGEPIIEQLSRSGVRILAGPDDRQGFNTSATTKPRLIENLALVFEREEWQFLDNAIWTAELEAYERRMSPITGRSQYSAPEGLHDDTVIARALMVWAGGKATHLPEEQPTQKSKWLPQAEQSDGDGSRWKRY